MRWQPLQAGDPHGYLEPAVFEVKNMIRLCSTFRLTIAEVY
jgi:hypothetical protein